MLHFHPLFPLIRNIRSGSLRAQSALFTIFGDAISPSGGVAWLQTITACMGAVGFSPQATRTALHRMAAEGWVEPSRSGRFAAYRLTPRGIERVNAAAARIYRLREEPWDGRWKMAHLASPVRAADTGKALRWWGYGDLDPTLWVTPHELDIRQLDLGEELDALVFQSVTEDSALDQVIVGRAWDLEAVARAHEDFLDRWAIPVKVSEPREAFALRIQLVHHWRSFLFLDPGLPQALLPTDWRGEAAAELFAQLWTAHSPLTWQFYDEAAAGMPTPPTAAAVTRPTLKTNHGSQAKPVHKRAHMMTFDPFRAAGV